MQEHKSVWQVSDSTTVRDVPMYVYNRMTADEMVRDKDRAERLLDEIDSLYGKHDVESLIAYGSLGRIGVKIKKEHDPLSNGVIVSNIDGFGVDAVKTTHSEYVYIRFQDESIDN